jgi:hypothetical protein
MKRKLCTLFVAAAISTAGAAESPLNEKELGQVVSQTITQWAKTNKNFTVTIAESFPQAVTTAIKPLLRESGPSKATITQALKKGIATFLDLFCTSLWQRNGDRNIMLSQDGRLYQFIEVQRSKCGSIPCPTPPCKPNCDSVTK